LIVGKRLLHLKPEKFNGYALDAIGMTSEFPS
jgi:hypothetical protein